MKGVARWYYTRRFASVANRPESRSNAQRRDEKRNCARNNWVMCWVMWGVGKWGYVDQTRVVDGRSGYVKGG